MDLVLGCCSTSLEQLHAQEMASGSCQQQPPPSLHSHILAELTQSAGAAPHSPVYVGGLVERCVILLFAFPARRERAGKSSQGGNRDAGIDSPSSRGALVAEGALDNISNISIPTARAFHRKSLTQAALNIPLLEDQTPQALQPLPEMLWDADSPWHSAEHRAAGNWELGITRLQSTKIAELQLLGQGWLGPQHPARQAAPSQALPALL